MSTTVFRAEGSEGILRQLSFYGSLKTAANVAVTDGSYDIVFKIYDAPTGGTLLWTGTYTTANGNPVSITNGSFGVLLGSGTGNTLSLDFNSDTYYLGITVGTDSEMTPRERVGAAAYAFNADKVDGLDASSFVRANATTSIATSSADTLLTITQNGAGDILNIFDGGTEVFSILDGGYVGIGSTSPSAKLAVTGDGINIWSSPSASSFDASLNIMGNGLYRNVFAAQSGEDSVAAGGFFSETSLGNSVGIEAYSMLTGTTTNQGAFGIYADAAANSSVDNQTLHGIASFVHNEGSGIVSQAIGNLIYGGSQGGTGVITELYGLKVNNQTDGITNYSIYTNQSDWVNGYALYNAGDGKSYFGGNVGIGSTSPSARLTIGDGNLFVGGYITATSTATSTFSGIVSAAQLLLTGSATSTANNGFNISTGCYAINGTCISGGGSGITSLGPLGQLQTGSSILFATSTSGTDFRITASGDMITFALPSASASARGLLSTSDWTSFDNKVSTSSIDTSAELAAFLNDETGSGALVFANTPTLSGFLSTASSTIGGGTQTTGLTINGGATTTGNAYFASNIGIGTTSPSAKLAIDNAVVPVSGELVTDGDFSTDPVAAGWTLQSGCAVWGGSNVVVTYDAGCIAGADWPSISAPIDTIAGRTYSVTFTLSGVASDTVQHYFDNNAGGLDTYNFSNGTHTFTFIADYTGTDNLYFDLDDYNTGGTYTIDTVSIKEIATPTPSLVVNGYDGTSWLTLGNDALNNTALGKGALTSNTTGSRNTANGYKALFSNTTGFKNVAIGSRALSLNTTGNSNNAVGSDALVVNTTGRENNAFGWGTLSSNTTGSANLAMGQQALYFNTTGGDNVANGYGSLFLNTTGSQNTAIGKYALFVNTTGSSNVALGSRAGYNLGSGNNNISIGSGSSGAGTYFASSTGSNQLNIGNLIYGTGLDGETFTISTGNIGIGTTSPFAKFSISANSGDTATTLFAISSSTPSATTNLFTVSNTGSTTAANGFNITGGCFAVNGTCISNTAGSGQSGILSSADWSIFNNKVSSTSIDTSAELASLLTDETGSAGGGLAVFSASPTFTGTANFASIIANSSSTIGGGTQTTGLTINGGATTTGNAYFASNIGIGTTSPSAKLAIDSTTAPTGSELITNGSFTGSATGWTLQTDCSDYDNNNVTVVYDAACDAGVGWAALTSNTFSVTTGTTYQVTFTISTTTNEFVYAYLDNGSFPLLGNQPFGRGTHTVAFTSTYTGADEAITFESWGYTANGSWTIDDVSIKEMSTPASTFAVTGWDGSTWLSLGGDIRGNTALGLKTLQNNTTGYFNTANGYGALYSNTTGSYNTANGTNALYSNTTGGNNIANGYGALYSNTTGFNNVANGYQALNSNTTGNSSIAIGANALRANTTGSDSVAIGVHALQANTTGFNNVANGYQALNYNTTGFRNTANGYQALNSNTTGSNNTANGAYALLYNTSATSSVAVGYQAARGISSYSNQGGTYLGYQSGYSAGTNSNYNTFLGYQSGYNNTTGYQNILLGVQPNTSGTGYLTTGGNNIGIGYNTRFPSATASNQLNIGNFIFGTLPATTSASTFSLPTSGTLGIGTSTPAGKFAISLNNGDTSFYNTAFLISSSTASATTTLFSVSSTGSTTAANGFNITSGCYAVNGTCISNTAGSGQSGVLSSADWSIFNNKISSSSIDTSAELASLLTDETGSAGGGLAVFSVSPAFTGTATFSSLLTTASSTIGGGTQATGLTINGGATTTGNAYFASNIGIGSTSPSAKLSIAGDSINLWSGPTTPSFDSYYSQMNSGSYKNVFGAQSNSAAVAGGFFSQSTGGTSVGIESYGRLSGAASAQSAFGIYSEASASSTANNTQLVGASSYVANEGSGSVTNAYGNYIYSGYKGGSGAITNLFGLKVEDQTAGTNNYTIWSGPATTSFSSYLNTDSWFESANVLTSTNAGGQEATLSVVNQANAGYANGAYIAANAVTGNTAGATGAYMYGIGSSTNSITSLNGLTARVQNKGPSAVTQAIALYAVDSTNTGGGSILSNFGLYVGNQTAGNANYSLYTEQTAGANNYALYNAGAGQSYFGGNVGVGTTSPLAKLSIASVGGTQPQFIIASSTGAGATSTHFIVDRVGNVGVGTSTPTAQLSTTGSVRFATFGSGTLTTDANGNLSVSSDERLKDIQGNFTKGLAEILEIDPISYRWKAETGFDTANIYTGFSAQNIGLVLPEAIGEDKKGFLSLSDRPLLAAVINAIKELYATLTDHSSRIEELETEVDTLKSQLQGLQGGGGGNNSSEGTTEPPSSENTETTNPPDATTNEDPVVEGGGQPTVEVVTEPEVAPDPEPEVAPVLAPETSEVPVTP